MNGLASLICPLNILLTFVKIRAVRCSCPTNSIIFPPFKWWAPRPAVTEFMTKLHWMHLIAVAVWYFAAALVVQTHFRVGTRWRHRWYSRRRPPSRHNKALSTWSTLMNQILSVIWILIFITYNTTAALLVTYLFMLWKDESNMIGSSVRGMCRQSFYKAGVCVLLHRWGQFFYYYTIHL